MKTETKYNMTKKEQIIELLEKYGNETDLFKAFIIKDEFSDLADDLVKLFAIPDVVGRSEQLSCKHVEKLMQGDGFVYVICALCGEDL